MKSKKICIILVCTSIFFNSGFGQSNPDFENMKQVVLFADSLVTKDQTDQYLYQLKQEINRNSSDNNLALMYYNLSVCYSAKNQSDSTCFYLSKCIRESPNYNNLILTDTDFDFIHRNLCWERIRNNIDSIYLDQNPRITNKELSLELYHIFLKDQHARGLGLKKLDKSLINTDKENLERVEKIIQEYGWPTYSMVGKTAADGAFMVIQHSDINTQKKYVKMIFDASVQNEASKESVAMLIDRISVRLKGMQIFGTQVYQLKDTITGKPSGPYKYFPIKDEANVDSLRNEIGLIPLQQYYSLFGIDYKTIAK